MIICAALRALSKLFRPEAPAPVSDCGLAGALGVRPAGWGDLYDVGPDHGQHLTSAAEPDTPAAVGPALDHPDSGAGHLTSSAAAASSAVGEPRRSAGSAGATNFTAATLGNDPGAVHQRMTRPK